CRQTGPPLSGRCWTGCFRSDPGGAVRPGSPVPSTLPWEPPDRLRDGRDIMFDRINARRGVIAGEPLRETTRSPGGLLGLPCRLETEVWQEGTATAAVPSLPGQVVAMGVASGAMGVASG